MLTGLIIGFVAGQIVGVVAAAFLAAARGPDESSTPLPVGPRRSRSLRFVLARRGGVARRSSGRTRVVA